MDKIIVNGIITCRVGVVSFGRGLQAFGNMAGNPVGNRQGKYHPEGYSFLKIEFYLCNKEKNMEQIELYTKLSSLPEELKSEVNDFIDFLISKKSPGNKKARRAGFLKGKIEMSPDFNEPLNDFKEYMQ